MLAYLLLVSCLFLIWGEGGSDPDERHCSDERQSLEECRMLWDQLGLELMSLGSEEGSETDSRLGTDPDEDNERLETPAVRKQSQCLRFSCMENGV